MAIGRKISDLDSDSDARRELVGQGGEAEADAHGATGTTITQTTLLRIDDQIGALGEDPSGSWQTRRTSVPAEFWKLRMKVFTAG